MSSPQENSHFALNEPQPIEQSECENEAKRKLRKYSIIMSLQRQYDVTEAVKSLLIFYSLINSFSLLDSFLRNVSCVYVNPIWFTDISFAHVCVGVFVCRNFISRWLKKRIKISKNWESCNSTLDTAFFFFWFDESILTFLRSPSFNHRYMNFGCVATFHFCRYRLQLTKSFPVFRP